MNSLFVALSAALFVGCAAAVPLPARLTLGTPKHRVAPPSSVIAGYESVDFSVRVTNTSKQPIWFYGQLRQLPFYRLFIRPTASDRWTDRTMPGCGMGAEFHEIAPGASSAFTVFVPGRETGHQLRVELPVYESPNDNAKSLSITSDATPIK